MSGKAWIVRLKTLREEMELAWKDVLYYKDKLAELARKLETSHDEELVAAYGKSRRTV